MEVSRVIGVFRDKYFRFLVLIKNFTQCVLSYTYMNRDSPQNSTRRGEILMSTPRMSSLYMVNRLHGCFFIVYICCCSFFRFYIYLLPLSHPSAYMYINWLSIIITYTRYVHLVLIISFCDITYNWSDEMVPLRQNIYMCETYINLVNSHDIFFIYAPTQMRLISFMKFTQCARQGGERQTTGSHGWLIYMMDFW